MRLMLTTLLAASFAAAAAADEKTAAAKPDKSGLEAIKEEYKTATPRAVQEFRAAKDKAGRDAVIDRVAGVIEKAVVLAEKDPKGKEAADALGFVVAATAGLPPTAKVKEIQAKASKLLLSDHIDSPAVAALAQSLGQDPSEENLAKLNEIADKAKTPKVKGAAVYALGTAYQSLADDAKDPKQGEEYGKKAEAALERVVKEFGDLDDQEGEGKIGKAAEKMLFAVRNLGVGKAAPEVESTDIDGKKVRLSDLKGKVVVLDIWATWCGPCRAMIPHEREMVKKLEGKPFVLVSVSADDSVEKVKNFLKDTPMPWTHWYEGRGGAMLQNWNVTFFPTIYVLDHKGVIRAKNVRGQQMEEAVEKLLKEAEADKKAG